MFLEQPDRKWPEKEGVDVENSLVSFFEHGQHLAKLAAAYESQLVELRKVLQSGSITVDFRSAASTSSPVATGVQSSGVDASASPNAAVSTGPVRIESATLEQASTQQFLRHGVTVNSLDSSTTMEEKFILELWDEWTGNQQIPQREYSRQFGGVPSGFTHSNSDFDNFEKATPGIFFKYFLIEPTSIKRMIWDAFTICFLAYDAFVFPLKTFGFEKTTYAHVLNLMITIFWTLDIYMSFVSGIQRFGMIEVKFFKIAKRYVRTWFLPDIAIITVDWILVVTRDIMNGIDGIDLVRLGKFLKVLHVIRIFRLVRVMKAVRVLRDLGEKMFQEGPLDFNVVYDIVKYIFAIVLVNHFIACGWHALSVTTGNGHGWVDRWVTRNIDISMKHQYAAAFHWSVCQFTPAPNTVHPQNFQERIFSIAVLLLGLAVFSSFLGSITSVLTQERKRLDEESHHVNCVHRYLADNMISLSMGNNIMTAIRQNLAKQRRQKRRLRKEDVNYLKLLPKSVMRRLNFDVFSRAFIDHPFLSTLHDERHLAATISICQHAMTELAFPSGAEIFSPGLNAAGMIFLRSGSFTYKPGTNEAMGSSVSYSDAAVFQTEYSLCETALWISRWRYKGHLSSRGGCFLFQLDHKELRHVVCAHHTTMKHLKRYARKYIARMREVAETEVIDDRGITPPTLDMLRSATATNLTAIEESTDVSHLSSCPTEYEGDLHRKSL